MSSQGGGQCRHGRDWSLLKGVSQEGRAGRIRSGDCEVPVGPTVHPALKQGCSPGESSPSS